jgi:hypothetical protein
VEVRDVFTILLLDASYCVGRASAQRVVDAVSRRETAAVIDPLSGSPATGQIEIQLSKLVRVIEHRFLRNDRLQEWWDAPQNVVSLAEHREPARYG